MMDVLFFFGFFCLGWVDTIDNISAFAFLSPAKGLAFSGEKGTLSGRGLHKTIFT